MTSIEDLRYLKRKRDEFHAAVNQDDARRAVGIIHGLRSRGYPEAAESLYKELNEALA
jgi:hypothetical protein